MNDMAGTAVRATVERIGKVPRYNNTAGVREREDANPAALWQFCCAAAIQKAGTLGMH